MTPTQIFPLPNPVKEVFTSIIILTQININLLNGTRLLKSIKIKNNVNIGAKLYEIELETNGNVCPLSVPSELSLQWEYVLWSTHIFIIVFIIMYILNHLFKRIIILGENMTFVSQVMAQEWKVCWQNPLNYNYPLISHTGIIGKLNYYWSKAPMHTSMLPDRLSIHVLYMLSDVMPPVGSELRRRYCQIDTSRFELTKYSSQ